MVERLQKIWKVLHPAAAAAAAAVAEPADTERECERSAAEITADASFENCPLLPLSQRRQVSSSGGASGGRPPVSHCLLFVFFDEILRCV